MSTINLLVLDEEQNKKNECFYSNLRDKIITCNYIKDPSKIKDADIVLINRNCTLMGLSGWPDVYELIIKPVKEQKEQKGLILPVIMICPESPYLSAALTQEICKPYDIIPLFYQSEDTKVEKHKKLGEIIEEYSDKLAGVIIDQFKIILSKNPQKI